MAGRALRRNLSSRQLHPALSTQLEITKQGPLKKKSKGVVPRWQERYFVLSKGELKYYNSTAHATSMALAGTEGGSRGHVRMVVVKYALTANHKARQFADLGEQGKCLQSVCVMYVRMHAV